MNKDTKRAPRNTEREISENPLPGLIIGMEPNGILQQEAAGQTSFVNSTTLPTDMGRSRGYDVKALLEAAGVKFLDVVEGDDIFQHVELPNGWEKKATSHSMWSDLVDDQGRKRAAIFYKAAFYDRKAHMSLSSRFGVSFDYDRLNKEGIGVSNVTDGDTVIHSTEPVSLTEEVKSWEVSDKTNAAAVKWLEKNYPDWRNPGAYWD